MVNLVSKWMCKRFLFSDLYSSPFSKFSTRSTADSLFCNQEKKKRHEKEMLVTSAVIIFVVMYPQQMAGTFSILFSCPLVRRHLKRYLIPRLK